MYIGVKMNSLGYYDDTYVKVVNMSTDRHNVLSCLYKDYREDYQNMSQSYNIQDKMMSKKEFVAMMTLDGTPAVQIDFEEGILSFEIKHVE